MVESLEILQLVGLHVWQREKVDGYGGMTRIGITADARTGNIVGVGSETIAAEDIVARTHYTIVVHVDVGNVDPRAHKVVTNGQRTVLGRGFSPSYQLRTR